jgi:AraC-like DNA-binding protein
MASEQQIQNLIEVIKNDTYQFSAEGKELLIRSLKSEQQLAQAKEEIRFLHIVIDNLRAKNADMLDQISWLCRLIANPHLPGSLPRVLIALRSILFRPGDPIVATGFRPITRAALARVAGISIQSVSDALKRLEGMGVLRRRHIEIDPQSHHEKLEIMIDPELFAHPEKLLMPPDVRRHGGIRIADVKKTGHSSLVQDAGLSGPSL